MTSDIFDHLKIVLVDGEEAATTVFLLAVAGMGCYYQEELLHVSSVDSWEKERKGKQSKGKKRKGI